MLHEAQLKLIFHTDDLVTIIDVAAQEPVAETAAEPVAELAPAEEEHKGEAAVEAPVEAEEPAVEAAEPEVEIVEAPGRSQGLRTHLLSNQTLLSHASFSETPIQWNAPCKACPLWGQLVKMRGVYFSTASGYITNPSEEQQP